MPRIFTVLDRMKPFYDITYRIVLTLCKILLVADILITVFAVTGRFVPFIPDPAWTEEVVLTLMAFMAMLSASLAIRRNAHIRMDVFDKMLPRKVILISDIICDVGVMLLGGVMMVIGWQYAVRIGKFGFYGSMPWLSRFYMYLPVPVAGAAMIIFEIEALYNHIRAFCLEGEE